MAYNLLITYDLDKPGQNYDAIHAKIKSLGRWHWPQLSVFYVHTALSPVDAHTLVSSVMDSNDRLIVAAINNIVIAPALQSDIDAINEIWNVAA